MANPSKRYLYKVYNSLGTYLGLLPNVLSDFNLKMDVNTTGSQINITVGASADTSNLPVDVYTDESGATYTDEAGANNYTIEGQVPIVSAGNSGYDTLIKNGNRVKVWEYSTYYPNGVIAFSGRMKNWTAAFGGDNDDDTIIIIAYNDATDMSNYLVPGSTAYTADQSQTNQNDFINGPLIIGGNTIRYIGDTITVGGGVTNIAAIKFKLASVDGSTQTPVAYLWNSYTDAQNGVSPLASATVSISSTSPTDYMFVFPANIAVNPGGSYFIGIGILPLVYIYIYDAHSYAGGGTYFVGSGISYAASLNDVYFVTYSGSPSLTHTYTSQDPTIGMLEPIMDSYIAKGGAISYNAGTIDATNLSLTYTFNTNTILEAVQAMLTLAPSGFYYYVDPGTNLLYFKRASTTADIKLTKGLHLSQIDIVASTEYVVNQELVSGGTVASVNIFTLDQDNTSITNYGLNLDRHSDNRITDAATAHAVGSSMVTENKNEAYMTQVTVLASTMDLTLLKPGKVIGFNGFGTFIDTLLAMIVSINLTPEYATIQLGILPTRLNTEVEQLLHGLTAAQTVANPSNPS